MSFFSNLNIGGGSTSAFGGSSTTSFSFGDFSSAVTSNASDGQGGINAGSAVNAGLDVAASAIPFGSAIKGVLDSFGFSDSINNALKYGLNSWGASTSPEQMKTLFAQKVLPYVESTVKAINERNFDRQLDELDTQLRINKYYHDGRARDSQADSSKQGHALASKEYQKLIDTVIPALKKKFESYGVKITKSVWANPDISFTKYLADQGQAFKYETEGKYFKAFYKYDVDYSNVKVSDDGSIESKSGSNGLLLLGGGLLIAVKKGLLKI